MNHTLLAILWLVPLAALHAAETPAKKPNVLLIIADDLNLALGCYGDAEARTPNLDRLAAEGVRFTRAYGQGAVCTPSRNSLITGLSTRTVGIHDKFVEYQKRDPQATSLGRHFRRNGYQTIAIGKVGHTIAHEDPEAWDLRPAMPISKAKLADREEMTDPRPISRKVRVLTHIHGNQDKTSDALRVDQFAEFLDKERNSAKPFFAALGFQSPHEPHEVYRRNLDAHPLERMPLVKDPTNASPFNPLAFSFAPWFPDEATARKNVRSYYGAVSQMDEQLGRVMALLEQHKIKDDTIVMFISDNGYHLGYRGQWAKHDVYPQVAHLPLIVRHPKVAKGGATASGLVEFLDIFPTLSELCGLPAVPKRDGKSFALQLRNPAAPGKAAAFIEWNIEKSIVEENCKYLPPGQSPPVLPEGFDAARCKTVYTDHWCYVEVYGTPVRELYQLDADSQAYFNVAEWHPAVVAEHAGLLHEYFPSDNQKLMAKQPKK